MRTKYPFYFQSAVFDCVPTCILALSEYYKVSLTLKEIRNLLITDPSSGTALKSLLNLQPYFEVNIGRITNYEEVPKQTPFVAYLKRAHAVIVWGFSANGRKLIVGDPGIGLIEMGLDDFYGQWEGLAVVLRPLEQITEGSTTEVVGWKKTWSLYYQAAFRYLNINWITMIWISLLIIVVAGLNSYYSMHYAEYLQDFSTFFLFATSFTAISGVLNWLLSVLQARISLRYTKEIGWKIRDAMPFIEHRFYTIGDISTRYQDAVMVVSSILGLYKDIPYALVIFGASFYFLCKISWLLGIFVIAFILFLNSVLYPFVERVRNMSYTVMIKDSEMMNGLRTYLHEGKEDASVAWEESLHLRYRQAIWSIPIASTVSNSSILPVLFVVVFLHWKTGGSSQYQELLSALMIMNYAVSAGHTLYGRYVSWQTAQPSFQRLKDFLEIDQIDYIKESDVS